MEGFYEDRATVFARYLYLMTDVNFQCQNMLEMWITIDDMDENACVDEIYEN